MKKYTLIITEKPDAARKIASALDRDERTQKLLRNGVTYYVAERDKKIVVVPALGHLYTIVGEGKGRIHYPVFSFKWVPRYVAERRTSWIRKWLQTITTLAKDAEEFIDACDFDVEGCVIGYCILKYACGGKEKVSRRMKFSTLTKQELQRAYVEPLPHLDFGLIEAGLARHEIDWLYGINLSRALTIAARKWSGKYATLSTGRVQGPTLKFLAAREQAIRSFVPIPYWQVKAKVEMDGRVFEAQYVRKRIDIEKEAETVADSCRDQKGKVEKVEIREIEQPPPLPFDLGTLQNEAYRLFGYSPQLTSKVAQQLYLHALISYPRTDSQKLPPTIDYRTILKSLGRAEEYSKLAPELLMKQTLKPNEGRKDDPAHPAIHPTGNLPRRILKASERKVWDLLVRRFMAVFSEPAVKQNVKVCVTINERHFHIDGGRFVVRGWTGFYAPYVRSSEVLLPPTRKGEVVEVKKIVLEDMFTQPPARYNSGSLLKRMEEARIGTKATRADVIQTLYDRNYIEGERMTVTSLGLKVFDVLEKHCPPVVSTTLTRELEGKMDGIRKNRERREKVLADAIRILEPSLASFKEDEDIVGEQVSDALKRARLEKQTIGNCPFCRTGKLIINHSRKTGRRFVGCTNYFEGLCRTSFPLPQRGTVRPTGKECFECGWPTVEVRMRRRPWALCFNPECPSRRRNERS